MIYFRKLIRYIFQSLWIQKKRLIGLLLLVPIVLLLHLITFFHGNSSYRLIFSLRYDFFYLPFFLIILIIPLVFNHCWLLLRLVQNRSQLALYFALYCFIMAFIYTLVVFLSALLLRWLVPLIWLGASPLHVQDDLSIFFRLMIIFLLVMMIAGLMSLLINEWVHRYPISAGLVIVLAIADRFTFSLVQFCFEIGYQSVFYGTLATLISVVVLLGLLLQYPLGKKDFLDGANES